MKPDNRRAFIVLAVLAATAFAFVNFGDTLAERIVAAMGAALLSGFVLANFWDEPDRRSRAERYRDERRRLASDASYYMAARETERAAAEAADAAATRR